MNTQESIWDDAREEAECVRVRRLIAFNRFKRWAIAQALDLAFLGALLVGASLVGLVVGFIFHVAGGGR